MTYRKELEDLRDLLWTSLQSADPKDRAGLARQYESVITKLAGLGATVPQEGSKSDELAERRAARLANPPGP